MAKQLSSKSTGWFFLAFELVLLIFSQGAASSRHLLPGFIAFFFTWVSVGLILRFGGARVAIAGAANKLASFLDKQDAFRSDGLREAPKFVLLRVLADTVFLIVYPLLRSACPRPTGPSQQLHFQE